MRRKQLILAILLLLAATVCMGMGDMLGGDEDKAPRAPKRDFSGTVTDNTLQKLAVSHIHCEGKTEIKGYLGEMRISLAFDRIAGVSFTKGEAGYSHGTVQLRDGQTQQMRFKNLTRCYGESELGKVMVRIKDLRSIRFNESPAEPEE
jgi:hypothetical protein